jgi:4-amino-4-deoxy-L-arabinose transferase-like glycosyltransferase
VSGALASSVSTAGRGREVAPAAAEGWANGPRRRWWLALVAIMLAGLALRVAHAYDQKDVRFAGDGRYYHEAANLLADGEGFIQPVFHRWGFGRHDAADFPPAWIAVLAVPSALEQNTNSAHRVWAALVGTLTIGLTALAGRRIAGPRVGLVAGALAAVYPNFWVNETRLAVETLVLPTVAGLLLAAYWYWDRPNVARAATVGAVLGLAMLTRAEAVLLAPLLVAPLVLLRRETPIRGRIVLLAVAGAATTVVTGPWVAYNLSRFEEPVLISTGLGYALEVGACDRTYGGRLLGYWTFDCGRNEPIEGGFLVPDTSKVDRVRRERALDYVGDHLVDLPRVAAARIGRTFAVYRPLQQLRLEREVSGQVTRNGFTLAAWYLVAAGSIAGVIVLRGRRIPVFPLLAPVATVLVTVALIFGQTRYRATAEVSVVVLAAVATEALLDELRRRRSSSAAAHASGQRPRPRVAGP